jgi:hypothetical protein
VIRIRRIGYNAEEFAAKLYPGEAKDVVVVLTPGVFELPEITVTARRAKPIEYAWTTKYADFFRRRRVGFGHFMTRADIDRRRPNRTADILTELASVRVRYRGFGITSPEVEFLRCNDEPVRVSVWIDGQKQYLDRPGPEDTARARRSSPFLNPAMTTPRFGPWMIGAALDRLLPSQIELMEVYRGPAEMPAEFLDDSCAAIVIWTR